MGGSNHKAGRLHMVGECNVKFGEQPLVIVRDYQEHSSAERMERWDTGHLQIRNVISPKSNKDKQGYQ